MRSRGIIIAAALFISATHAMADVDSEVRARQALASKLLKLSRDLDMKEARYEDSKGGGGKDFNSNDGNSFTSNTTYHSNVWDYCMQWVGGRYCRRWLPAYVSGHGFTADQSPLEGTVAAEWKRIAQEEGDQPNGNQYAIWNVEKPEGGAMLDADGKLDRSGISKWELRPEVKAKVENIGDQTAVRQISLTYDDTTEKNTMPNMEGLRMMAERWTRMMRNRSLASVGELRAMNRGVEVALDEANPNCDSYADAIKREPEDTRTEERRNYQNVLDPETNARTLQQRITACKALRAASIGIVNATYKNGGVQAGNPNTEQVDKWRNRLQVAVIDRVGLNPNELAKPGFANIDKREQSTELVDYDVGGQTSKKTRMTNAEQLQSYNNNLEVAAAGMSEVSARSGGSIVDTSAGIRGFKIARESMSVTQLNGLTPEMRGELKGTAFPRTTPQVQADEPAALAEESPAELTITKAP